MVIFHHCKLKKKKLIGLEKNKNSKLCFRWKLKGRGRIILGEEEVEIHGKILLITFNIKAPSSLRKKILIYVHNIYFV